MVRKSPMHRRQASTSEFSMNRNETWINNKGFFVWYIAIIAGVHLLLLSMPFLSTAAVWTLTNAAHSIVTFVMFHWLLGAPFVTFDEHSQQNQTQWEQIDSGTQLSLTKKTLIIVPIVLFLLTTMYTDHTTASFVVNLIFLGFCIVPKHPSMDGVRLFGMNRFSR